MSQAEVERFLGRLITDANFREMARESPGSACYSEGIGLSAEELELLGELAFPQFALVAETLDDALRRK